MTPHTRERCCRSALITVLLAVAAGPSLAEPHFIVSEDTGKLGLPFSDAVRIGDLLVLSGQLGVNPSTFTLVEGGIEAETHQIFSNMKAILDSSGADLADIAKCTVMISDIAEWPTFNTIYMSYFPGPKPARSALGANGLALGARVELECWADVAAR